MALMIGVPAVLVMCRVHGVAGVILRLRLMLAVVIRGHCDLDRLLRCMLFMLGNGGAGAGEEAEEAHGQTHEHAR